MDTPLKPVDRTTAEAFDRVYATERSSAERERIQAIGKQKKKKHDEEDQYAEPEDLLEVSGLETNEHETDDQQKPEDNEKKPADDRPNDQLDVQA